MTHAVLAVLIALLVSGCARHFVVEVNQTAAQNDHEWTVMSDPSGIAVAREEESGEVPAVSTPPPKDPTAPE